MFTYDNKSYFWISNDLEMFSNEVVDLKIQFELDGINKTKAMDLGTMCVKILNFYEQLINLLNECIELTNKPFFRIKEFLKKYINSENKEIIEIISFELNTFYISMFEEIRESQSDLKFYERHLKELNLALENDNEYNKYYDKLIEEAQIHVLNNTELDEEEKKQQEFDIQYLNELKEEKENNKITKESIIKDIKDTENEINNELKNIRKYDEIKLLLKEYLEEMITMITNYKNYFDISCGFLDKKIYIAENLNYFLKMFSSKIILPQTYMYRTYEECNFIKPIENLIFSIYEKEDSKLKRKTLEILEKVPLVFSNLYEISTLKDILNISLSLFIENKFVIKKCKNCGKYFIPHNKQVYCDNPSPQNPNKTCRSLSDDLRDNKNPIYEVYRNNYKTQSNKKRRNAHIPKIEERFKMWNKLAREEMEKCVRGEITLDEYKQWHKNNQNWIKKF